ncbi:MAG: hypothetical protein U0X20_26950 [Caldilineaceae bacterium]
MTLETIITKEPVIETPTARALAEEPKEYEARFTFHVNTHVTVADLADKWDRMLHNLEQRKSVTGLIYADTGYGKTSTAAALWQYAEARGIVAVPPFLWASMTDMLIAAYGWSRFRLETKRPDLVEALDRRYGALMQSGLSDLSARLARTKGVSIADAQKIVEGLSQEGQVSDVISASRLIDFLEFLTKMLCDAGYKGLLLLPDEFELFETTNSDIAKNFAQLKEFIFPLFQINDLPLGCVVVTYKKTQAQINQREPFMLARFNKPEGSLINLETVYGSTTDGRRFPEALWDKLSIQGRLSHAEQGAISPDVLNALGQFLAHPRSTSLLSGPRSVVAAFRRAALHFRSTGIPYSVFDFCADYLNSGIICYNQQEIEAAKAYASIMGQGVAKNSEMRKRIVQLLCVMPEGVPHEMFLAHGIPEEDRIEVVQALIGTYVITTTLGPTLAHYRPSEMGGDQMVEVLKTMRDRHNPGGPATLRAAVRGFVNHLIPTLLSRRIGAAQTGWSLPSSMDTDLEPVWTSGLSGTANEYFPDRTLSVHVGDVQHPNETGKYSHTDLHLRFILHTTAVTGPCCQVTERGMAFHLHVTHPFDTNQVPGSIRKLGDVFLPERVTPLLLLDMLDFFDAQNTKAKIAELKLDAQVKMLRTQILNELTNYIFSEGVKRDAVEQRPSLAQIPIGKDLIERALAIIIRERYPDYHAVAISHQWVNMVERYRQILVNQESLGIRRGDEPFRTANMEVPNLFAVSSHSTFRNTYYPNGVLRHLLRIDELDTDGRVLTIRIESSNNNKPVGVLFTLHPLEREILQCLEETPHTVPGRDTKAIKKADVYSAAEPKGYLADEVDQLIKVLTVRGLVAEEDHQGVTYLYLQKTEISMAELVQGLEELEMLDTAARNLGLIAELQSVHRPNHLRQRLDDPDTPNDEIAKDHLRRDLREAKQEFRVTVAQWLKKAFDNLINLDKSLGAQTIEIPKILDQATGNPTTEFSTVLFIDIRRSVLELYQKYNSQVSRLQGRVREAVTSEKANYEQEQSLSNAVTVVGRLTQYLAKFRGESDVLQSSQEAISANYAAYQKWRELARQIEEHRLILVDLADDDGVRALLSRLDNEQALIKAHLADRGQTPTQVLDAHEHFRNRIRQIITEFDEVASNREQKFLAYQGTIHDELKRVLTVTPQSVAYNRTDDEGVYSEVNQRAVNSLHDFCDGAIEAFNKVRISLLKPLEVFQVESQIRTEAQSLNEDVRMAKQQMLNLKKGIDVEHVQAHISEWVTQLRQARDSSAAIVERHERIMARLRSARDQLGTPAQILLREIEKGTHKDLTELIISLRGTTGSDFDSAGQIIQLLAELYQHNWINIQIDTTSGQ